MTSRSKQQTLQIDMSPRRPKFDDSIESFYQTNNNSPNTARDITFLKGD